MQVDHTKNIIEVKDVNFSYENESVLQNIDFQIHKGDYLGIVGPNGAGKTTLIKIILGLIKPTTGSVKIYTKKIGYVPQKVTNFDENFPATVREVVAMGNFKNKKAVDQAIEQVSMSEFAGKLIGQLSGGQQQRVFLARALVADPEIIFLDEPTTGIDKNSQDNFYKIIKELNATKDITIVLVTHDIDRITKEAMHILCVDHTLTCHSSPQEYLQESVKGKILGHHHH